MKGKLVTDVATAAPQKVKKEENEDEEEEEDSEMGEEEMMEWALRTLQRTQYLSESSSEDEEPARASSNLQPSTSAGLPSNTQVSLPSTSGHSSGNVSQAELTSLTADTASDQRALKREPSETEDDFPQLASDEPSEDPLSGPVKEEVPDFPQLTSDEPSEDLLYVPVEEELPISSPVMEEEDSSEMITPDLLPAPEHLKAEADQSPLLPARLQQLCVITEPPAEEQGFHQTAVAENLHELRGETEEVHQEFIELQQSMFSVSRVPQNNHPLAAMVPGNSSERVEMTPRNMLPPQEPLSRKENAQKDVLFVDLADDSDDEGAMDVDVDDHNSSMKEPLNSQLSSLDAAAVRSAKDNRECSISPSQVGELDKNKNESSASEDQEWTCKMCCKSFRNFCDLGKHHKTHFHNGMWMCFFCDKTFIHFHGLRCHRHVHFRHAEKSPTLNSVVQKSLSNTPVSGNVDPVQNISSAKSGISASTPVVDGDENASSVNNHKWKCICDKSFRTRHGLENHQKTLSSVGPLKCCGVTFKHPCTFTLHRKKNCRLGKKAVVLNTVVQESSSGISVSGNVEPVETISSGKSVIATSSQCTAPAAGDENDATENQQWGSLCDRTLANPCELTNHRKIHLRHEEKAVTSNAVAQQSSSNTPVSKDVQEKRKWMCSICDKSFLSFAALEIHGRTHFNKENRMCSVFDETYSRVFQIIKNEKVQHRGGNIEPCSSDSNGVANESMQQCSTQHRGNDTQTTTSGNSPGGGSNQPNTNPSLRALLQQMRAYELHTQSASYGSLGPYSGMPVQPPAPQQNPGEPISGCGSAVDGSFSAQQSAAQKTSNAKSVTPKTFVPVIDIEDSSDSDSAPPRNIENRAQDKDFREAADGGDLPELAGKTKQTHHASHELERLTSSMPTVLLHNHLSAAAVVPENSSERVEMTPRNMLPPQETLSRRKNAQKDVQFVDVASDSEGEGAMDVDVGDHNSSMEEPLNNQLSSLDAADSGKDSRECSILPSHVCELEKNKNESSASENRKSFCEICCKSFRNVCDLKEHRKMHFSNGKWMCYFCDRSFTHLRGLRIHRHVHSRHKEKPEGKKNMQKDVPFVDLADDSDDEEAMDVDLEDHRSSTDERVSGQHSSVDAVTVHSEADDRECSDIPSPVGELDNNENKDSAPQDCNCVCSICDKIFKNIFDKLEHRKTHCINGMWMCYFCDETFTQLCGLTSHKRICCGRGKKSVALSVVPEESSSNTPISGNVGPVENISSAKSVISASSKDVGTLPLDAKGNDSQELVCSFCDKNFRSSGERVEHEKTHCINGMWMCYVCDRSFANLIGLEIHKSKHFGHKKKSVALTAVAQGSSSNIPLSANAVPVVNISSAKSVPIFPLPVSSQTIASVVDAPEQDKWVCIVCDERFGIRHDMEKHQETHFKRGAWLCCFCDKPFSHLHGLLSHEMKCRYEKRSVKQEAVAQESSSTVPALKKFRKILPKGTVMESCNKSSKGAANKSSQKRSKHHRGSDTQTATTVIYVGGGSNQQNMNPSDNTLLRSTVTSMNSTQKVLVMPVKSSFSQMKPSELSSGHSASAGADQSITQRANNATSVTPKTGVPVVDLEDGSDPGSGLPASVGNSTEGESTGSRTVFSATLTSSQQSSVQGTSIYHSSGKRYNFRRRSKRMNVYTSPRDDGDSEEEQDTSDGSDSDDDSDYTMDIDHDDDDDDGDTSTDDGLQKESEKSRAESLKPKIKQQLPAHSTSGDIRSTTLHHNQEEDIPLSTLLKQTFASKVSPQNPSIVTAGSSSVLPVVPPGSLQNSNVVLISGNSAQNSTQNPSIVTVGSSSGMPVVFPAIQQNPNIVFISGNSTQNPSIVTAGSSSFLPVMPTAFQQNANVVLISGNSTQNPSIGSSSFLPVMPTAFQQNPNIVFISGNSTQNPSILTVGSSSFLPVVPAAFQQNANVVLTSINSTQNPSIVNVGSSSVLPVVPPGSLQNSNVVLTSNSFTQNPTIVTAGSSSGLPVQLQTTQQNPNVVLTSANSTLTPSIVTVGSSSGLPVQLQVTQQNPNVVLTSANSTLTPSIVTVGSSSGLTVQLPETQQNPDVVLTSENSSQNPSIVTVGSSSGVPVLLSRLQHNPNLLSQDCANRTSCATALKLSSRRRGRPRMLRGRKRRRILSLASLAVICESWGPPRQLLSPLLKFTRMLSFLGEVQVRGQGPRELLERLSFGGVQNLPGSVVLTCKDSPHESSIVTVGSLPGLPVVPPASQQISNLLVSESGCAIAAFFSAYQSVAQGTSNANSVSEKTVPSVVELEDSSDSDPVMPTSVENSTEGKSTFSGSTVSGTPTTQQSSVSGPCSESPRLQLPTHRGSEDALNQGTVIGEKFPFISVPQQNSPSKSSTENASSEFVDESSGVPSLPPALQQNPGELTCGHDSALAAFFSLFQSDTETTSNAESVSQTTVPSLIDLEDSSDSDSVSPRRGVQNVVQVEGKDDNTLRRGKLECFKCKEIITTAEEALEHVEKHFTLRKAVGNTVEGEADVEESGEDAESQCSICDKPLKLSNIVEHISLHWLHKCNDCGRRYMIPRALCDHQKECSKEDCCCPLCEQKLENLTNLPEHLQTHLKYICPVCRECCGQPDHLKQHLTRHFKQHAFHCETCDASFFCMYQLNSHIKNYHREECKRYDEILSSREQLSKHYKRCKNRSSVSSRVSSLEYFKCVKCKKTFSDSDLLHHLFNSVCFKLSTNNLQSSQFYKCYPVANFLNNHKSLISGSGSVIAAFTSAYQSVAQRTSNAKSVVELEDSSDSDSALPGNIANRARNELINRCGSAFGALFSGGQSVTQRANNANSVTQETVVPMLDLKDSSNSVLALPGSIENRARNESTFSGSAVSATPTTQQSVVPAPSCEPPRQQFPTHRGSEDVLNQGTVIGEKFPFISVPQQNLVPKNSAQNASSEIVDESNGMLSHPPALRQNPSELTGSSLFAVGASFSAEQADAQRRTNTNFVTQKTVVPVVDLEDSSDSDSAQPASVDYRPQVEMAVGVNLCELRGETKEVQQESTELQQPVSSGSRVLPSNNLSAAAVPGNSSERVEESPCTSFAPQEPLNRSGSVQDDELSMDLNDDSDGEEALDVDVEDHDSSTEECLNGRHSSFDAAAAHSETDNRESSISDSGENENNATDNQEWMCNICDKNFLSFRELDMHRRTHFVSENGMTSAFDTTFSRVCKLTYYEREGYTVHGGKLKCFKCGDSIRTVEEAMEHVKQHFALSKAGGKAVDSEGIDEEADVKDSDKDNRFLCPICDDTPGLSNIVEHVSLHWWYKCKDCGRRYMSPRALFDHKRVCYKEDRGCPLCSDQVKDVTKLPEHLLTVMQSICPVCGECFHMPYSLEEHLVKHFQVPTERCEICGGSYLTKYQLKCHMESCHGENRFRCKRCNQNLFSSLNLKIHYMTCKKQKRASSTVMEEQCFECDKCKKTFTKKYQLRLHILNVCFKSLSKNFQCNKCSKWFSHEDMLSYHKKVSHRMHECKQCGICGKAVTHLDVHMKIHRSERNFVSEESEEAFRWKHHRENHARKRSGECPYHCKECGDRFKTLRHLIQHRKIHKPVGERRRGIHRNHPITYAKKIKRLTLFH